MPDSEEAGITSVCVKEFLSVMGNGQNSVRELIQADTRASLYEDVLKEKWAVSWNDIPKKGNRVWLQPIGNHCKGTKFLNANDQIDDELVETFSGILRQMNDYYYGRFDLRCVSWEQLKEGRNMKILEFNGVNSEPAHVYDPDYGILNRYRDFYRQWSLMAMIHEAQTSRGIRPLPFKEVMEAVTKYFKYLKVVKSS